jgi:hypothetical protein
LTPFYTNFVNGNSILPGVQHSIAVTYDPSLPGSSEAQLEVTTGTGAEKVFALRGLRKALPVAQVGFSQLASSSMTAGDEVEIAVQFESDVETAAAPEEVEIDLTFNTDVLSLSDVLRCGSWTMEERSNVEHGLRIKLTRPCAEINTGDEVARFRFKSFVAADDSTSIALKNVVCNPSDPGFSTCTLATIVGASRSITVGAGCGVTELRKALRNQTAVSVSVHPNPVTSGMRELKLSVQSLATSTSPLFLAAELVDLQGKSFFELRGHELRTADENVIFKLDSVPAGSYTLRTTIGDTKLNSRVVIMK